MNPNHLHLACDTETALPILRDWFDNPGLELDGILEDNGWTTFDLDCDFLDTADWRKLGSIIDLIYASYCTSLRMGELVVVRDSVLQRHFLHHDADDSAEGIDVGKLPFETGSPIQDWSGVCGFVDDWRWTTLA